VRLAELRRSRFVQLGLLIGAVATTLLCVTLFSVYRVVDRAVLAQIDAEIDSEFSELASLINDDRTDEAIALIRFRVGNFVGVDTFYLLIDARTGAAIGNIQPVEPVLGWFTQPTGPAEDELSIRAYGGTMDDGSHLAVGRATAALDTTRSQILGAFVLALGASALASLGATAFLTVRLWRRVDDMRQDLALVQGDFRMRLGLTTSGDEFDGIASAVNHLLDRLEESIERLREVSVDIAHDLRTPLTRIRHRLETASEQSSEAQRHVFAEIAAETDRLIDTFNSILRIAQIEGSPVVTERLDLSAITRELAEIYAPVAEEAGKPLAWQIDRQGIIRGDASLIRQLLANLIENAINHAAGATRIELGIEQRPDAVELVVRDNGCGIPQAMRVKVLDRFVRLDQSRGTPGNGLGLSLVRAVAARHQAVLTLTAADPGSELPGLLVSIRFPPYRRAEERPAPPSR
jgi:signal transduction histidine kinase